MIRIGTIAWFVILALLGVGLFQVKYAVQAKERELRTVNKQITADRQILRVLEAEWSYLNDPVRLADLTRRHTDLAPAMANQIATFGDLRERPALLPDPLVQPDPAAPLLVEGTPPSGEQPVAAVPASAVTQEAALPSQPSPQDGAFATASAPKASSAAGEPVDEDATIRAILADMEAQQNGSDTAPATTTAPASGGAGAE